MTVIAFVGKPRTGKTLHMTFMAYDALKQGHKIFANYKLMFPYTQVDQYDMLRIPFDDVDREPKTLCIQEADKIFDSHRSMKNENTLLSSLTGQAGKRNLNIYYDTQFWNRIDGSLRYVTEYICSCSCIINTLDKTPVAFEYTMIDTYDESMTKHYVIPASILRPYYSMYNSYETTKPLVGGKSMQEISGQEEEIEENAKPKRRKRNTFE